jgi:hypothetical protein
MMEKFEELRKRLSELATLLNEFRSEAVQLRILEVVLSGDVVPSHSEKQNENTSQRNKRKKALPVTGSASTTTRIPSAGRRKRGAVGTGAPATLVQLLADNFFDQPRTINDVIEHCKHNLARTFKANEFSGKLGRMVRKGELSRKKNADKQYEYKEP